MRYQEALSQIDAIRTQMAQVGWFRGYRAATVAGTALLGCLAAAIQPIWAPHPESSDLDAYLVLWVTVAAVSVAAVGLELTWSWWRSDSELRRRQIIRAAEQFLPCIVAGAVVTWGIADFAPHACELLPGLWAILFSLGVFASLRQLPPAAIVAAGHYLVAGALCLILARDGTAFSPWAMFGAFGCGQILTASVLYWNLERRAPSVDEEVGA